MNYTFDPALAPYNAACDGVTDDTAALQSAINDAEAVGGEVLIKKHKTSAPLSISGRVTLRGYGFHDDGACGYAGQNFSPLPAASTLRGSIILPGNHDAIHISTDRAVILERFQISYDFLAASGNGRIGIRADAGGAMGNTGSIFRDLVVTNADYAMWLTNMLGFKVDNARLMYSWNGSLILETPNYPSYGGGVIEGCEMWGGAATQSFHILAKSHGGLRIHNNWLQAGGPNISSGILIQPNTPIGTTQQQFEPLLITDNTMEGQTIGVCFNKGAGVDARVTQFVLTGNQIWSGLHAFYSVASPDGDPIWIQAGTISGGALMVVGAPNRPIVRIDGARDVAISADSFCSSSLAAGTAVWKGPNTANIRLSSNVAVPGVALVEP
jgi:hypothetical protein